MLRQPCERGWHIDGAELLGALCGFDTGIIVGSFGRMKCAHKKAEP